MSSQLHVPEDITAGEDWERTESIGSTTVRYSVDGSGEVVIELKGGIGPDFRGSLTELQEEDGLVVPKQSEIENTVNDIRGKLNGSGKNNGYEIDAGKAGLDLKILEAKYLSENPGELSEVDIVDESPNVSSPLDYIGTEQFDQVVKGAEEAMTYSASELKGYINEESLTLVDDVGEFKDWLETYSES